EPRKQTRTELRPVLDSKPACVSSPTGRGSGFKPRSVPVRIWGDAQGSHTTHKLSDVVFTTKQPCEPQTVLPHDRDGVRGWVEPAPPPSLGGARLVVSIPMARSTTSHQSSAQH